MKIHFERSGGFAGRKLQTTLDSAELPAGEAERLERLVESARFFDRSGSFAPEGPGADRFQYRLTVESAGRAHTLRAGDTTITEELRPLVEWLTARARGGG